MKWKDEIRQLFAVLIVAIGATLSSPASSRAQDYEYMNCGELWYARNQIYADRGYCFKTERGRRAFGRNCFPPYGKLSPPEEREVRRIETWEYRKGCR